MTAPAPLLARLPRGAVLLLFLGASLALYANALDGEFVFDDRVTIMQRGVERDLTLVERARAYRPVRFLSFALDRAVGGGEPWAYHLFNALYHGLAAYVVFLLLARLLHDRAAALAGALLFLCHPVHTEAVAYVSGRRDLLTTLFYLLAFLAYLRYKETGIARWLWAVLLCFVLALGAKEMAATLPAICLLHDFLFDRATLRRRIPVLAAAFGLTAIFAGYAVLSGASRQEGFHGGSAATNFLTVARLLVHYASLLVAPVRLVADYSYDTFPLSRSLLEGRTLFALVLLAALGPLLARAWRRAPLAAFGGLWFFVTLLPVCHIVPFHELAAEHYLYLPSFGFCLLAALGFRRLRALARPRWAWAGLGIVLALFAARTVVRNRDWHDAETLWRATIGDAPRCARAHLNLANVLAGRRDFHGAVRHLERALEIRPDYLYARTQLARVYGAAGRRAESEAQYEEVLRVITAMEKPPLPPGEILFALHRYAEALEAFESDVLRRPRSRRAWLGVALCRQALGRDEEAYAAWEKVVEVAPKDPRALAQAAALARKLGALARAAELEERLRLLGR